MMSSTALERRPLGRAGLETTVMGYGAGGHSRAGPTAASIMRPAS